MIYGIVLGCSIIVGALMGMFWWGVAVGIIINILVFLWTRHGSWVIEKWKVWQKSTTTSATAGTSTRTTRITQWFHKRKGLILWPIFLIPVLWLIVTYPGRVVLQKAFHTSSAVVNGGEYMEYEFRSLKPKEFTAPASGRWKFEVIDQKEYRYQCPGWQGDASGYLKEVKDREVINSKPLDEYPLQEKGYPGALLIYSEVSRSNPLPSGEEFIIGSNQKFFIEPNLTQEEKKCKVTIPTPVKFVLHRVE